jgi:hypothetical protein
MKRTPLVVPFWRRSYETGLSMEERVTSLFQPDTLLPEQYLDTFRRKLHLEPEKKLMLAVLEDAIACFQKYAFARDGKGKMLFQDAEDWVQDTNNDWLFSFANVCETLGFDPDYLRQGLAHWKAAKLESQAKAKIYQLAPSTGKRGIAVTRRARHRLRVLLMRSAMTLMIALAAGLVAASVFAQEKPHFSGRWTLAQSTQSQDAGRGRSGARGGFGSGGGLFGGGRGGSSGGKGGLGGGQEGRGGSGPAQTLVIKQDAETLTIEGATGQGTQTNTYKLDGSESVNSTQRGQIKSKASWDGNKLVITSTGTVSMMGKWMTIETKEILWLDTDGTMVIETTRSAGGRSVDSRAVYRKTS